jgi:pyridoxine/pyridoxamine 5'-phosphate oxidase
MAGRFGPPICLPFQTSKPKRWVIFDLGEWAWEFWYGKPHTFGARKAYILHAHFDPQNPQDVRI